MTGAAAGTRSDREATEFLPDLVAIDQRPPSRLARSLLWVLLGLIAALTAGAWWGRVDVVVVAPGRFVPSAGTHPVQPVAAGVVRAVLVQEGSRVDVGDPLLELDATAAGVELTRIQQALGRSQNQLATLQIALAAPAKVGAEITAMAPLEGSQGQLVASLMAEHRNQLLALAEDEAAHAASLRAHEQELLRLDRMLPLAAEEADALRTLLDRGLQSRPAWLQAERQRLAMAADLAAAQHRGVALASRGQRLQADRATLVAGYRRALLERLTAVEAEQAQLQQLEIEAKQRLQWSVLRAPAAGTVHRLAITAPGAVVAAAQPLAEIVPAEVELEVECWLAQADAGRVRGGQSVSIKVDAFPFTDHGVLIGELIRVGADAIEHPTLGSVYPLRVRQRAFAQATTIVPRPGMALRAEIHLGTRRLADYLLEPLLAAGNEALREP